MLEWLHLKEAPDWTKARWVGALPGVLVVLLVVFAIVAWVGVLSHTIHQAFSPGTNGPNLGAGALIAALLSSPFLIWGTWLNHRTVTVQNEGHITDRINKAVEMLGAEKKVDRIGRAVTIWTGTSESEVCREAELGRYEGRPRTKFSIDVSGEWGTIAAEMEKGSTRGRRITVTSWPKERTVVEYKGSRLTIADYEEIGTEGDWKVFSETVPNIEVRIGAILSLERIAQDSTAYDKGRDHVRVMEILCAYVRENAPARTAKDGPLSFDMSPRALSTVFALQSKFNVWADSLPLPRADIEIAIRVIGRRNSNQREIEKNYQSSANIKGYVPDLSHANLQKVNFEHLDFSNTNFFKSKLEHAYGKNAVFAGCNFTYCDLSGISAPGANFSGAGLEFCNLSFGLLQGSTFTNCKHSYTFFVCAELQRSSFDFSGPARPGVVPVNRVFFYMATLQGALLQGWLAQGVSIFCGKGENDIAFKLLSKLGLRNAIISTKSWISYDNEIDDNLFGQDKLELCFGDRSCVIGSLSWPKNWPSAALNDMEFETEWRAWQADPESYVPPPEPKQLT